MRPEVKYRVIYRHKDKYSISEIVPSFQIEIVKYGYMEYPEKVYISLIADAVIFIAATIGGILIFNKSDLK